jgi:hypothetical protein
LLPKSRYPDLVETVQNLVPACTTCNHIKRSYDPSGDKGRDLVITDAIRTDLVRKAREEIKRKEKADDWRTEFPNARDRFRDAVAKYRKAGGC